MSDEAFLRRWSRRKRQAGDGAGEPTASAASPSVSPSAPAVPADPGDAPPAVPAASEPAPTLLDVERLTHESDFRRFVAPGVDADVRHAALKKLFSHPRFNVMDGLDTYIDDYNRADPLPQALLKKVAQARFLGLVDAPTDPPADENADLRLQSHDAAGCAAIEPGAAGDAGRKR